MPQIQTPLVLNKKQLSGAVPNAVYIGRPSIWGNPFVIGKDGTRAEVVVWRDNLAEKARQSG